ncbi:glycosyltransferase family 87 protein [Fibrella sp. WM1]|uniref:glycosyltransferase family 87 protein n=1 Tax=Fibrella musci TaxID=3242485 RepID=UPI0035223C2C
MARFTRTSSAEATISLRRSLPSPLFRSFWTHKWTWSTRLTVGLIVLVILALAIREALTETTHGDFYIFWSAGVNFRLGNALYSRIGGAEEFLYPPFAPFVFQLLSWLPFRWAVGVFTVFNGLAWINILGLVYKILKHYFPATPLRATMLFAGLASWRYFYHNILWVNINELVCLLCLGGILLYLRRHENWALALLMAATWLKVMPVLLVGVLFFRRPLPVLGKALLFSAGVAAAILLERGWQRGVGDFVDFWQITLNPFLAGKVYVDWISFSIPSALFKLLTAHGDVAGVRYYIADWPVPLVRRLSTAAQLLVVGITYWQVWRDRQAAQLRPITWVLVLLSMILVAGVTWEGHHVTLALTLAVLYVRLEKLGWQRTQRVLVIGAGFVSLLIYDLVGARLYNYLQGFSLITVMDLLLFGLAVRLATIRHPA